MKQHKFDLGLQERRPIWKDILIFMFSVGCFWEGTHIFLNYNAFAQIASFKIDQIKTTLFEEPKLEKRTPLVLKKVESKKQIFRNKNLKPRHQAKKTFENMPVYPSDNRIYIPRIKKNVPLLTVPHNKSWEQLEKNIQKGLQDGVVVHPISRKPGHAGNFFITGHSSYYKWDPGRFKDVFALLHEVMAGDLVEVYWAGKKYTYEMKAKEIIAPTATNVLNQPDDISILTLMTCTPVGTNKNRLILVGELVENSL